MVDAGDLKFPDRKVVRVRLPLAPPPLEALHRRCHTHSRMYDTCIVAVCDRECLCCRLQFALLHNTSHWGKIEATRSLTFKTISIPASYGLTYHLHFSQNGMPVQQMDLEASGCRVLIIGKNDTRVVSEAFITSFAQTMGISLSQIVVSPLPFFKKPTL
jgi:hypothetical protein